ncbi:taste receptor type 2 member 4-like [Leptodactylus fuscus]|uniref:taste receptor type 2 member 4-like n=1 Tax=Leptodactylus fuscus TaxID=238119 RepID=UPI003F4EC51C
MVCTKSSLFEVLAASMSTLGLIINIFIITSNVLDWLNSRKVKPYDKLMMSLGLARVFLFFCFLFRIFNRVCELNAYPSIVARWVFRTAQLFFDFSSLWFAMWLCVLYYVKIAVFKNTLLLRFELSIPHIMLPILLKSSVISFTFGFIFAFNIRETSDIMDAVYVPINESFSKDLKFMLPSYFFGHFVPFLVSSVSNFFLIGTIFIHIRHVKKNNTSFTSPNLEAHLSALRSVSLLQIMNTSNLIGTLFFRFDFCTALSKNISFLILNTYPALHSVVLITGNAKLKRSIYKILDCVRGCFKSEIPISIYHLESKKETVTQQK